MTAAISAYFHSEQELRTELLARIARQGDMPSFSKSVQSIVGALADDGDDGDQTDYRLIQVVLTDANLTQKVLRLANSAMYALADGAVTTVTRAVAILGTQAVAHLALGLKVVESFDKNGEANDSMRSEMDKAMIAGVLGRQFAGCTASVRDAEEAAVCSVLRGLGRMLVAFYFPEAWKEIERLQAAEKLEESEAVYKVLSSDFDAIGQFIAANWGLPPKIVSTLRFAPAADESTVLSHEGWLSTVGSAATSGARILYDNEEQASAAMAEMLKDYAPKLGVDVSQMISAVDAARTTLDTTLANKPVGSQKREQDRNRELDAGLADLRTAVKTMNLSQSVALAVEFLHQALSANRSFYFLRSPREHCFKAKFGLGDGAGELVPSLKFDEQFRPDVFHAVMASDKLFFTEDVRSDKVKQRLPLWWLASLGRAQSFCLIPLSLARKPLGFLYLDWSPEQNAKPLSEYSLQVLAEVRLLLSESIESAQRVALAATR